MRWLILLAVLAMGCATTTVTVRDGAPGGPGPEWEVKSEFKWKG